MSEPLSNNEQLSDRGKQRFSPRRLAPRKYFTVIAAFVILGVFGGYAYYALIGCSTGGCAITSNPYMSMAWGGLLGYLLPDFFVKKAAEEKN